MVIPLLICSDNAQTTLFGNKTVYPLYLTIRNIPKNICRKPSCYAQIVLAYLPTSYLKHVTSDTSQRQMVNNLFHSCLREILAPIRRAAVEGILMKDGNGVLWQAHPILASYISDYLEQIFVTGMKTKDCPKCNIPADKLGSLATPCELWNLRASLNALSLADSDPQSFWAACNSICIKLIFHPFWEQLLYLNIYQAITPDILHQLHQGVFKHLLSWQVQAYGANEINAHCQRLIPNHHIHIFSSGITSLSRVTGKERNLMSHIILGVIIGVQLLNDLGPPWMIHVIHAFLDFLYLAHLPIHSSKTLSSLNQTLQAFHENVTIFIDLDIRKHFNIPKFHVCQHYESSIRLYGSTDNYDTQHTEHLHKFSKELYQASNKRDELPQMMAMLAQQEQVHQHIGYVHWRQQGSIQVGTQDPIPNLQPHHCIKMTKRPSAYSVSIEKLETDYGTSRFRNAFVQFIFNGDNQE